MRTLALGFTLVLCLFGATRAEACRGPFPPLEESVKRASTIFVGTVREVRELADAYVLVFAVDEALKGEPGAVVEVRGPKHTCGFGRGVEKGQRLLIFAGGNPLSTGATSNNRRSPAEQLLAQVRGLLAPAKK